MLLYDKMTCSLLGLYCVARVGQPEHSKVIRFVAVSRLRTGLRGMEVPVPSCRIYESYESESSRRQQSVVFRY